MPRRGAENAFHFRHASPEEEDGRATDRLKLVPAMAAESSRTALLLLLTPLASLLRRRETKRARVFTASRGAVAPAILLLPRNYRVRKRVRLQRRASFCASCPEWHVIYADSGSRPRRHTVCQDRGRGRTAEQVTTLYGDDTRGERCSLCNS